MTRIELRAAFADSDDRMGDFRDVARNRARIDGRVFAWVTVTR